MKTFQTNIDKLVSKILNEEIDSKFEEKFNNKRENFESISSLRNFETNLSMLV